MANEFPTYFPANCPPSDAQEVQLHVYRFCKEHNVTESDFVSYYQQAPTKWADTIEAYGLSVILEEEECIWALNALPAIKKSLLVMRKAILHPTWA